MEKSKAEQFVDAAKKWLSSAKNTADIEFQSIDESAGTMLFEFKEDEVEFTLTYPKEEDDLWGVASEHLDEEFGEKATESAMSVTRVQDVLRIVIETYNNMDDDFDDFGGGSDDDWGDVDDIPFKEEEDEEKEPPLPEVDTSIFSTPSGYEAGAVQAIVKEYQRLLSVGKEELEFEATISPENLALWTVKLGGIPKDEPLWKDMAKYGISEITFNVLFPSNYPWGPPFIRVIRPRFAFRTGHVTVGGAFCTHLLSNEGWNPMYRLQQVFVDIRSQIIAGNGRLDFSNRSDYTEHEAMDAFRRLLRTHGWTHWKK